MDVIRTVPKTPVHIQQASEASQLLISPPGPSGFQRALAVSFSWATARWLQVLHVGKPRCPVPGSADASNAALLRHWVGTCMYLTDAAGETGRAGLCGPYSGSFVSTTSRGCAY